MTYCSVVAVLALGGLHCIAEMRAYLVETKSSEIDNHGHHY